MCGKRLRELMCFPEGDKFLEVRRKLTELRQLIWSGGNTLHKWALPLGSILLWHNYKDVISVIGALLWVYNIISERISFKLLN